MIFVVVAVIIKLGLSYIQNNNYGITEVQILRMGPRQVAMLCKDDINQYTLAMAPTQNAANLQQTFSLSSSSCGVQVCFRRLLRLGSCCFPFFSGRCFAGCRSLFFTGQPGCNQFVVGSLFFPFPSSNKICGKPCFLKKDLPAKGHERKVADILGMEGLLNEYQQAMFYFYRECKYHQN